MITKHVVVLPYNEAWKKDFEDIKAELMQVLEDLVLSVEHVGSTSVPGLAAKPVIDIDVVIEDQDCFEKVKTALGSIGYHHEGEDHLRKHHLYVCSKDAAELKRHISFRDYLRAHPEAVEEYGRIKTEGAELYPYDIDRYIEHKSPFIEGIYQLIGSGEH